MHTQAPLILTLQLNQAAFDYFNALRKQHFPPEINYLDAHVTLFHHLPAIDEVTELLITVSAGQPIMDLMITKVIKLGRGVAFQLQSEALMQLQAHLKHKWQKWLTPQDQQGFRPHVTVQNKVSGVMANALFEELTTSFKPFNASGLGLSLWEYRGGPWYKLRDYPFSASSAS